MIGLATAVAVTAATALTAEELRPSDDSAVDEELMSIASTSESSEVSRLLLFGERGDPLDSEGLRRDFGGELPLLQLLRSLPLVSIFFFSITILLLISVVVAAEMMLK